jgi:hypothetical protein
MGSLVLGVGLLVSPARVGAVADLTPRDARVIAVCELALVPGLLGGRRQGAWMLARAITNLDIIARLPIRRSRRARASATALGLLTVADVRVAIALRRPDASRSPCAAQMRRPTPTGSAAG